jgi:uncharacterized protein
LAIRDLFKPTRSGQALEIPIFPLNTVLCPGGLLPLKVFEQRYIDMTKLCLRDGRPFGVCLIREGGEVGTPATPERVGCLSTILEWDMQQLGIFELKTLGTARFAIRDQSVGGNGLITAEVNMLVEEPRTALPEEHDPCARVLRLIIDKLGNDHFREPFDFEDAAWVSYRLIETLPLKLPAKQKLLELDDSRARLMVLHKFLTTQGLTG